MIDCGSTPDHFVKMRDAIAATKRPMVYSIHSPWTHGGARAKTPHPSPAESVAIANSARTTNDITRECSVASSLGVWRRCQRCGKRLASLPALWETVLDRAHTNNLYRLRVIVITIGTLD
jgi:hypothetical protein